MEENEVAGFVVFSEYLLIGYFSLGNVNVNDCPVGLGNRPRQGLEIGEELL